SLTIPSSQASYGEPTLWLYLVEIPCDLDSQFSGMVEAWASGLTWREIMMDCAMDDGDLARLLRRTIDLLAQCPPPVYIQHALPASTQVPLLSVCKATQSKGEEQTVKVGRASGKGEFLADIPKLPDIDPLVQKNAMMASDVMDRPPISELAG
ncbi:hypothetical protein Taro_012595, partial [Colocasia esculenta]|nr:hypothetical protein [Colocasia esculenta]